MPNALATFDNRNLAEAAIAMLRSQGVPETGVVMHFDSSKSDRPLLADVDEVVTGGLVGNMRDMFQGLFEWSGSVHDTAPYSEAVRRGGAVLSITVAPEQCGLVEYAMHAAQCKLFSECTDRA